MECAATGHKNHNRHRRRSDHASLGVSRPWRWRAVHQLLLAAAASHPAAIPAPGATPIRSDSGARLSTGKTVSCLFHVQLPPRRSRIVTITATLALQFAATSAALGVVMTTAESIWHWQRGNYGETGVWPWYILRADHHSLASAVLTPVLDGTGLLALLLARLTAAILVPISYWWGLNAGLPLFILILSQFLLTWRCRLGGEGGDQMTTIMLMMAFLPQAIPNEPA